MSASKIAVLTLALLAALLALTFEAREVALNRTRMAAREKTVARLAAAAHTEKVQRALDRADPASAALAAESTGDAVPAAPAETSAASQWIAQTKRLRQLLAAHPDQAIPELQLLGDRDWLFVAQSASLDDEAGRMKAFGALRSKAKSEFATRFQRALRAFVTATGDELPASTAAFLPYFDPPIDPAILDRYEMLRTGKLGQKDESIIAEQLPVNLAADGRISIGVESEETETLALSDRAASLFQANAAFKQAHGGREPTDVADILPYIRDPATREKVQDVAQAGAAYAQAHGALATDPAQFRPYLKNPASFEELFGGLKTSPPQDSDVAAAGFPPEIQRELEQAMAAWTQKHEGLTPVGLRPEQLRPYMKDPAKFDEFLRAQKAEAAKTTPTGG